MSATASPYRVTPKGKAAGRVVRELRRAKGLSTTDLSHAIHTKGVGTVSPATLRRIEQGVTPRVRVQYAVAQFFGREPAQIWPSPRDDRGAA